MHPCSSQRYFPSACSHDLFTCLLLRAVARLANRSGDSTPATKQKGRLKKRCESDICAGWGAP
eukprot:8756281-Alexandrium_andersonii.AAC.1